MSNFVEKLRLKGMAEEDIYFAKRDIELIEALRKKKLAKLAKCNGGKEKHKKQAESFERRFESMTDKHKKKPRKLLRAYQDLLKEIVAVCKRRER